MKTTITLSQIFRNFSRLQRSCFSAVFLMLFLLSASSSWGQIAQRGSYTTASTSSATSAMTIDKPTGVVAGDVMIASIVQNETDNDNGGLSNVTSTGWTLVDGGIISSEGTGNNNNAWHGTVLYRVADGTEGSSFSFSLPNSRADMAIGSIVAFSGVDVSGGVKADGTSGGPFDVDPSTLNIATADGTTATATTLTTTSANSAVIMLAMVNDDRAFSGWAATSPSSLTELYDNVTTNVDDASVGAAWAIKPTAGATGNGTVTLSGSDRWGAILIALKPKVFYSKGSLAPQTAANWNTKRDGTGTNAVAGDFTSGNKFVIENGDVMTTTGTWTISGTGANIHIESGGTLIASNAVTTSSMEVASGGTYQHNQNGGSIPTATWDVNSTCSVTGVVATVPTVASFNQPFGNFTWNCPSQTGNLSLIGELLTVNGNFTITNTNTGSLRLSNSGVTDTLEVGGNFSQTGGSFFIAGTGGSNDWIMNVAGNFSLSGGTLDMNGGAGTTNLNVSGNFTHSGGTLTETGSATTKITMNGTNSRTFQSLGQSNSVQITINKTGTATNNLVTLSANSRIDSNLTLTDGLLELSTFNLTLGASTTITGGSTDSMIVPVGTGEIRRTTTATGSFVYPIGDNTGTLEYTPVTVNVTAGSGFSSAYIGVSLEDGKHSNNNSTTNFLTRSWRVNQSGITGCTATITGTYINAAADVTGTLGSIKTAQLNGTFNQATNPWVKTGGSVLSGTTLTYTGATITSGQQSIFTGITSADPTVSVTGGGVTVCKDATVTLTADPVGDTTFTYLWSSSLGTGVTATPSTATVGGPTSYTVTVKDGNGISSAASTAVAVTVVAKPVAPGLTKNPNVATVCSGSTLSVSITAGTGGTGTTADEYRFSTNNGGIWSAWSASVPSFAAVVGTNLIESRRTATGSGCSTSSSNSVSWTVNALPTVTSATGNSKTYTGIANATTVSAVASAGATIDWYDASTGGTLLASGTLTYAPEGINVGTYTVYAQARDTTAGCTSTARTSITLTINVATPTVTVTVGTYTYNASAQGPNAATNTGTGSSYTFSYVGTGSTTYAASSTRPTAAGTYTATATVAANGNFGSASSSATAFTIGVATPTVTVTVGTYTYNASAQGPTAATNTGTGSSYTFSYVGTGSTTYAASSTRPTAAGTYTATATVAANGNFGSASSSATAFTIGVATPVVTVTVGTYTYDGTAQGPTAATNTGTGSSYTFSYVGTGSTTYAASSTRPTAAGTYTATATVAANGNFGSASSSATAFTIGVATPTVTVTVGTYTYNGSAQGPNAATNTGTGSSYTFSYVGTGSTTYAASSTRPTAAGTYTATATVAANGNFGSASSSATAFTIGVATPTVTVTVGTYTYNASAQGPTAATNTGTGSSYTFSYVGTGSTTYAASSTRPTAAGTYTATATVAANGNFGSASSSATAFTIGVATPVVTVTVGTYTYDGTAQGPTAATNTGTGSSYTFSYVGTGETTYAASSTLPTAAGTYTATATVAANGNFGSASSSATAFTIGVATPTVTVTVGTYTYNGSAQGPNAATNTGTGSSYTFSYVGTGSTTYAASSTRPTAAGTYTASATVAANGNFGSASSSATAFTIGVATPVVTVTVGTYTYNGSAQGPNAATNTGTGTSYTFSYVGTGSTTYAASSTRPTDAGTYTATLTVAANGNFGSASSDATSFSIATKDLTITANNATKCFGETYTLENTAFTSSGLQNEETIGSVTLTSSGISSDAAAASYSIVPSDATGGTFTASNYSINYVSGFLVVNPVSVGGTIAGGATVCSGTNSTELTLSGHTGSVTRWESSLDDFATSGTPIANTTETLTATNLAATTSYRAVVTSGACAAANSATATVTVTPALVAPTSATASVTTMCGSGSATLTLTGGGGQGATIKWYTSSCGGTLAGTGNNLVVSPTSTTTYYGRYEGSCDVTSCASVTITFISATTTTWNGTTWSNGEPTASTAAIISGTFTSPGTNPNYNLRACKLTVNAGATVLIKSGDTVTLDGALIAASGSFVTFNSGANLIQYGTTNENTGAIIIKRESARIKRLDYTIWSSPVAAQGLQAFSPNTLSNRFYSYNSSTNLYQAVDPSATNFSPFNSYLVRTANTHPTTPATWTGQFTGVPNNGNYSMAFTGYRLIGNPYPSAIDAENFIDTNIANGSITGTVYFWRKTNGSSNAAYCTYNLGGFVSNNDSAISNMTVNPNSSTNVVQVGQGFIVEGTGTSNVVFTNDMRIDSNVNRFLRTANTIERNRIWLNITNAAGSFSQAMIAYMTGATQGVDPSIDGKLLTDGDVSLASLIGTTSYAIQGRALPFDMTDVVPMSFKVTTAGDYTITIDRVDGLFSNGTQTVYLRDNTTGVLHNLSAGGYTFTSASGTFDTRFEIIYQTTSLAVSTPTFNESQVVIYKTPTNEISINTGNVVMSKVKIFDIRGRLLQEQKDINASQTLMNAGLTTEVLLVQITSEEGIVVTKKVLFPRTSLKLDKKIEVKTQLAEDE